jgi:hypothetical protein
MPDCVYHWPTTIRTAFTEQRLIALRDTPEPAASMPPASVVERLSHLPAEHRERVLLLLYRLIEGEPRNPPRVPEYAKMQEVLTLMGYMSPRSRTDATAVLNTASLLASQNGTSFTDIQAFFRQLWQRLRPDEAVMQKLLSRERPQQRRQELARQLGSPPASELSRRLSGLPAANLAQARLALDQLAASANTAGLKSGGYKQPRQTQLSQTVLKALGYYAGVVDSDYGPGTRLAVKRLQTDLGITSDGAFGDETFLTLRNFLEERLAEKSNARSVPEKIKTPDKPPEINAEVRRIQENQKTFLDYLKQLESIHGSEIVGDILNLRFDPRDMSDKEASSAYTPEGRRLGRTFFKQNGEIYFSVSRNVNDTNFNNRLFYKFGDNSTVFIFPRKSGKLVPVIPTNREGIFLSEHNGEKLLLDKAGYMAHQKGKKYVFEDGHAYDEAYSIANIRIK